MWLKQQTFISSQFWRLTSEIKVLSGSVSFEDLSPGLGNGCLMAVFSLVFTWSSFCGCLYPNLFFLEGQEMSSPSWLHLTIIISLKILSLWGTDKYCLIPPIWGTLTSWWLGGKEFACQCWRLGVDPWDRKIPWRRKWQLTLVFLPGKSHGQRSWACHSPWGHKESDTT